MRRLEPPRWLLITAALLALVGVWRVVERGRVEHLLARARSAPRLLDYHGTQTTSLRLPGHGELSLSVALQHQAPDRFWRRYQDGELRGTEVVSVGGTQWRYDPRLRQTFTAPSTAELPLSTRAYLVSVRGGGQVAGRATDRVRLRARGVDRLLWLDRETGIVLRSRTAQSGQLMDTAFQTFALGRPVAPATFAVPGGSGSPIAEAVSLSDCARRTGLTVQPPREVPAGFRLIGSYCYNCPCGCGMLAAQLLYGDGVGWLSVFYQDRAHAGCVLSESCCKQGEAAHACVGDDGYGINTVARVDRQPVIVVVGDASSQALAKVADSVP
ncbi:MAG: hypothetical protein HUU35_11010 [Armatimonadetes bacterium]|nr:hypothetical protein [Armatimonadota bacterium]